MELSNEFEVTVPIEEAWGVLTDLERIAPCLPGATLTDVEGDEYHGTVKVKVGPITAQYKGTARIAELDAEGRRVLLEASGRDTRGQGTATASIRAELQGTDAGGTHVSLVTDLAITGKVAQFGRGVMGDVSAKLLTTFVENLEREVLTPAGEDAGDEAGTEAGEGATDGPAPAGAVTSGGNGTGPQRPRPAPVEAEPIDLLETAGSPMLKRILPLLGVVAAVLILRRLWRRRRRAE